jgi:hypothetical protein
MNSLTLKNVKIKPFGRTYHIIVSKKLIENVDLLKADKEYDVTFAPFQYSQNTHCFS